MIRGIPGKGGISMAPLERKIAAPVPPHSNPVTIQAPACPDNAEPMPAKGLGELIVVDVVAVEVLELVTCVVVLVVVVVAVVEVEAGAG